MIWTDATIERLKTLVAEGLSATQIAGELGMEKGRCAVIGKVSRLGLQLHGRPSYHTDIVQPKTAPEKASDPAAAPISSAQALVPLAPTPTMGDWKAKQQDALRTHNAGAKIGRGKASAFHQKQRAELLAEIGNNGAGDEARAARGDGVALMGLRGASCRWPMGDPMTETFLYCGEPRDGISVYCACHRARAYTPRAKAPPVADREMAR